MAKKRKVVQVIENIDTSVVQEETDKPKCFNSKKPYCIKELCEKYFDSCRPEKEESL